jgi:antitoxin VapB
VSRAARREALLALASASGHDAVVLSTAPDVAWYTGGFDVRIDRSATSGSTVVVVSAVGEWVVTDAIEAPRLRDEEPVLAGLEVVEHPWADGPDETIARLVGRGPGRSVACDLDVSSLRMVLDAEAVARYREVGADAGAALAEAAASVDPAMTELEAAAVLAAAAWRRRGLHAPVLLVGGESRVERFRHPVPTDAPVGTRAMLVGSFERGGLYASTTTFVHAEPPSGELARRFEVVEGLLRLVREATAPGRTLGEVFADLQRGYADASFPDEWRHHHQGGIAGYRSREMIATPGDATVVRPGMAFAWNPSVPGAKAEETFVLPPEGGAPEVLT